MHLHALILALLLALPGYTFGQRARTTAQVNVGVTLLSGLEVTGQKALVFGDVAANSAPQPVYRGDTGAGKFVVSGGSDAEVTVRFIEPSGGVLEAVRGAGGMEIETRLFGSSDDNAESARRIQYNEVISLNEDGEYFFFLEGTLSVGGLTENPPGNYLGTYTLVLNYQ